MAQIDIRLHGEPDDVSEFNELLAALAHLLQTGEITGALEKRRRTLDILDSSRVYPDRPPSKLVREYLKVKF